MHYPSIFLDILSASCVGAFIYYWFNYFLNLFRMPILVMIYLYLCCCTLVDLCSLVLLWFGIIIYNYKIVDICVVNT